MAVEARHNMNLFSSHQLITNRDFMKTIQGNGNIYDNVHSVSSTISPDNLASFYRSPICDAKTTMNKADSGLTCNIINPAPRKRQRDSNAIQELNAFSVPQKGKLSVTGSSFLDKDVVFQIHQHQSEIDRFIAQHTEKVRIELEHLRKRQARILVSAIQEGIIVKKLKEKDEEIQRMGKLNWVLQERVKTLCVENQLWKDLAQSNEATANSLRSNLEQVLLATARVCDERHSPGANDVAIAFADDDAADDAESCCGSSDSGREENDVVSGKGICRRCGEREARVLVLPCRHLCLCTACGSTHRTCPVCTSVMTASVHVNFS